MIVALDLGSWTGVAWGEAGSMPTLDTWRLPKGDGAEVGRFAYAFETHLQALINIAQPTLIVFEAPFLQGDAKKGAGNVHTVRRSFGMAWSVERLAYLAQVEVAEAHIGTVRKTFCGSGAAKKADVTPAAIARGFNPANDHEADAVAVWFHTVALRAPDLAARHDPLFAASARA